MSPTIPRRRFVFGALTVGAIGSACTRSGDRDDADSTTTPPPVTEPDPTTSIAKPSGWFMPAEGAEHERTWMC
jgi:hypothetical protein